MEDKLIEYSTAKLAKEKGFCNGSDGCYFQFTDDYIYDDDLNHPESYKKDEIRFYEFFHRNDFKHDYCEAPTQNLLRKWLRDKHFIEIRIEKCFTSNYYHVLVYKNDTDKINYELKYLNGDFIKYYSYEEALEISLQEALKLMPNNS